MDKNASYPHGQLDNLKSLSCACSRSMQGTAMEMRLKRAFREKGKTTRERFCNSLSSLDIGTGKYFPLVYLQTDFTVRIKVQYNTIQNT